MSGQFFAEAFQKNADRPQIKMIEIKLSQGSRDTEVFCLLKILLKWAIRHVQPYTTVYSPPHHSAFNNPVGLVLFIQQLRKLCGGKPVGFKLCVGKKSEFVGICRAMIEMDTYPDFITVDGGEGGTGAAPQEFSNYVGAPLMDGLAFVHNMLVGFGIRQHIKVIASGKILSGFHILRAIALGADACNSASHDDAIGCIQALLCNTNRCPTGVATQDPQPTVGLVVEDKSTGLLITTTTR